MDKLCLAKDLTGTQTGSRVLGDCDRLMSLAMQQLMIQDALRDWENERSTRMSEYDGKRAKSRESGTK